ncbi:MAG: hypothetical protein ABIU05_09085, partial [Nitrospirales bacterium]
GGFSQSETTRAAMMESREMTDPLSAWLDRATVLGPELAVSRKDLTISYNAHAEECGRPPMTAKAFCQAIRRLRPTVGDSQRMVCGSVQWVFLGLGLAGLPVTGSHHSRDSHYFSQIRRESEGKEERENKSLKIGNGVNGVNDMNPDPAPAPLVELEIDLYAD